MIVRLRGEVVEAGVGWVVLDVAGVGYEVQLAESLAAELASLPGPVTLAVRQVVREDSVALYGFRDAEERALFDLLVAVPNCGPKTALSVLSELGADGLARAVGTQDARELTRAKGVGVKLAERIVLELRDKLPEARFSARLAARLASRAPGAEDPLVEALLALGYRRTEAEAAARQSGDPSRPIEERLRAALRELAR